MIQGLIQSVEEYKHGSFVQKVRSVLRSMTFKRPMFWRSFYDLVPAQPLDPKQNLLFLRLTLCKLSGDDFSRFPGC